MKLVLKNKGSIILEVAILMMIGVIVAGQLTYNTQRILSRKSINHETELLASRVSDEVAAAVNEYPASKWLMRYWYEHSAELDIEYDVDFSENTKTEEKCRLFTERHPQALLKYMTTEEVEALSPEDQKLYAEITYSWLITRVNQIKRNHAVSFLFCVITEEPYDSQFFLFSAAEKGAVRGTNYEEVYPLGTISAVNESQQEAMSNAMRYSSHLADAGKYVDYYAYLDKIDDHGVLIGMTYNLSSLTENIRLQTIRVSGVSMCFHLFQMVLCLLLLFIAVLRPMKEIQYHIRLYTENKDSATVEKELSKVHPNNEIGVLSEDVISLAKEIDEHVKSIEKITAEKERANTELALATQIQANTLPNIFPPYPERDDIDIFASMTPAKEVGGDFYDFFLIDHDHLGMMIADVSGKGVPAALFMMSSKILIENIALMGPEPAQVLERANAQICKNNVTDTFVTVWYGVLEISTGKVKAANAGHEYPILKGKDGKFEIFKDKHGFVLGVMEGMKYRQYEFEMEHGDTLFLYTDGAPEATDAQEEMFGMDRLLASLNKKPNETPKELTEIVRADVNEFVGDAEQFDDLTMLCIKRT